jgi:adenylate kinase family enzyme
VPLNVLLLGIQGSGKGTQAKRIAAEYDLAHIATGDILRKAIAEGNTLGEQVRAILDRVLTRLTLPGALYLAVVATLPSLFIV